MTKAQDCTPSAAPQMRERGLRSVRAAHELADDKADAVLLKGYGIWSRLDIPGTVERFQF